MPVRESFAVQIHQHIQSWLQKIAGLFRRKSPLRKDVAKIFLGVFHHHIKQIAVPQAAPTAIVNGQKIGVREMRGAFPKRQLRVRVGRAREEKLDGGVFELWLDGLRQENRAMVRASQKLPQGEFSVDSLAFPLFPWLAHGAPRSNEFEFRPAATGSSCVLTGKRKHRSIWVGATSERPRIA